LQKLLDDNANLNTLYVLKEQLQALWQTETVEDIQASLEQWCLLADENNMLYLPSHSEGTKRVFVTMQNTS
jgi:hypothetical protein